MATPDPSHQPWNSHYQLPPPMQHENSTYYPPSGGLHPPIAQPYYAVQSSAPVVAELAAPLPPAPPTTTPDKQLHEDELLARKIQQLDMEEARRRSSSNVSQPRPTSMIDTNQRGPSPFSHPPASHTPHLRSQSFSSENMPYSPGSFGQPPGPCKLLPQVIVGPGPAANYLSSSSDNLPIPLPMPENLPIPVIQDQYPTAIPAAPLDPHSLSTYLEQHRQVPYPPQWQVIEPIATFYAYQGGQITPGTSWLDTPDMFTWRTIRPDEHAHNPAPPSYTFKFKTTRSSFRSPRHEWVMTCPEDARETPNKLTRTRQSNSWAYDLKLDAHTGLRKTEVLRNTQAKTLLTTYVHAKNYDSLRFIGPDGRAYMWASSATVSSLGGARYDTLRHALFVATGNSADPLYGEIVADHTYWDGYVDESEVHVGIRCQGCQTKPIVGLRWKCKTCAHHDVCNMCYTRALSGQYAPSIGPGCIFSLVGLPDEVLYIRSTNVDIALIVATFQVLKDWEKQSLRQQKRQSGKAFLATEDLARDYDLGLMSYWRAGDWTKKSVDREKVGTRIKARSIMTNYTNTAAALGNVVDTGFAIGGVNSGGDSGSGGGADSSGGFSGGGGDGGGGGGGGGGSGGTS